MRPGRVVAVTASGFALASGACLLSIDESRIDMHALSDGGDASDGAINVDSAACGRADATYAETVLCDHPLAYWRLGETGIVAAARDETNTYPATYAGVVGLGIPGAIAGDSNTAAHFGEGGSSVMIAQGTNMLFTGANPASFEAWIRPTSMVGEYFCPLTDDLRDDAGRQGYALCVSQRYGVSFERFHDFTEEASKTVGDFLPAVGGPFVYVVGTFDGALLSLYVNAKLYQAPVPSKGAIPRAENVSVGGVDPLRFLGDVDEVAIYGYALTAAQVLAHYQLGSR